MKLKIKSIILNHDFSNNSKKNYKVKGYIKNHGQKLNSSLELDSKRD